MKIVLAPDKFKDSLTGFEFCDAVTEGILKVRPDTTIIRLPLADGGDGTLKVVNYYLKGKITTLKVNGPLFRPIMASWLYSPKKQTAFIEMAGASGLELLKDNERDPVNTTSFGTGELIKEALKKGVKKIILGIGGSATNDMGIGMAAALGYRFLDKNEKEVEPIGKNLIKIQKIQTDRVDPLLKEVDLLIASDVKNPLFGKNGAAFVYAAQKGASEKEIEMLDRGLQHLSDVIIKEFGTDLQKIPGAGAAGGLGGGAVAFLNGKLSSGIDIIKDLAGFDQEIEGTAWIISGEGKLDLQTLSGKVISGVLESAKKQEIPVAAFCGKIELNPEQLIKTGIDYAVAISENEISLKDAYRNAYQNLVSASKEFAEKI